VTLHRTAALVAAYLAMALSAALPAQESRIVEWVEDAPLSDNSRIALGYPVPVPVDTPLPFAGFRSYAGLHARHQDLAATTPWVHEHVLGHTHHGRTIWLYQLGDPDRLTTQGLPEQAMLTNGGIHAREWQSPEVASGIIELIALADDGDPLTAYLRDNANILVIPVLNVDGFLQTQRSPALNWVGADPNNPEDSPRDGRMRRKNMLGVDEDLMTEPDHLLGVDLNRNNPPFWATNPNRSSDDPQSLVHHGTEALSEPESLALVAGAELGPAAMLSMYTDMHSYSQVHAWVRNDNDRLAALTERLLQTFSAHHRAFPAGKNYAFADADNVPRNSGIGLSEEMFTHHYQVPSWTLEIEPSNGASYHAPLPGAGADYGGLGRNGHDGFILPESEIERVRSELAQSFAVAYYQQSGPPSVASVRIADPSNGAIVFEAIWDTVDGQTRDLHRFQAQPLQLGRSYLAWVAWDKPMRWRNGGEIAALPGQPESTLDLKVSLFLEESDLAAEIGDHRWLDQPAGAPHGFANYRDDAFQLEISLPSSGDLQAHPSDTLEAVFELSAFDMTGNRNDADPSTVARWKNGAWAGYEDSEGNAGGDRGGIDRTIRVNVTPDDLANPFVVEPGTSSTWADPSRPGEGFVIEILSGGVAVMYWFTYDSDGRQDWYMAEGKIRANRILFEELVQVAGGRFGPGFDPDSIVRTVVGSASFIWSSCNSGEMEWLIEEKEGTRRQHGRMALERVSSVLGLECGEPSPQAVQDGRGLSGSWFDPSHSGEGYALEMLSGGRALVYWFSFDTDANRRWFFGVGEQKDGIWRFTEMNTTRGPLFGAGFDPEALEIVHWGSLTLDLTCGQGQAEFQPGEDGFLPGTLELRRLTVLDGIDCADE
jgi:hypothetical protein